jgi:hypothetical protein
MRAEKVESESRMVHEAEEPHRLQRNRLASRVGAADDQRLLPIQAQFQLQGHGLAALGGLAPRLLPERGQAAIEERVASPSQEEPSLLVENGEDAAAPPP